MQNQFEHERPLAESSCKGFWHAFFASFSVIIFSELGDRTFFITAIMAMRDSRVSIFMGALTAAILMTILSVCLGFATQIIPQACTFYVSIVLFAFFGVQMLKEGYYMSPNEAEEEYEEAEEEIQKHENKLKSKDQQPVNNGVLRTSSHITSLLFKFLGNAFVEVFMLTFLAEWGDRSQITTIILAARENVVGVTLGGTVGHALCNGVAVIGGRLIAQRISVRTVTLAGGILFILFAVSALFISSETES